VDNTLLCNKCGRLLFETTEETDPVDNEEMAQILDQLKDRASGKLSVKPDAKSLAIKLRIGAQQRLVEMPLNQTIHLGRKDPNQNILPEVDLSQDGPAALSVSRLHAKIFKDQDDDVLVEDLGSSNGTLLNGQRLTPETAATLIDGDTLHLGKLLIKVNIQRH
jgi:pSer/pThr/pTyr-binding forkhead associated (FHA) protein